MRFKENLKKVFGQLRIKSLKVCKKKVIVPLWNVALVIFFRLTHKVSLVKFDLTCVSYFVFVSMETKVNFGLLQKIQCVYDMKLSAYEIWKKLKNTIEN